jgi:DNA polymerase-3 subunit epsilon
MKRVPDNELKSLYMVCDTETTGFSPNNHDIVQIAGIIFRDGVEKQRFNMCCKPKNWGAISQEAMDINGHTEEKMRGYDDPEDVCNLFVEVIKSFVSEDERMQIIAHNMPFDYNFIQSWFNKCGRTDFFDMFLERERCICTQKQGNRANKKFGWGLTNGKLITFAQHFGIEFDAHDALGDTIACAGILDKLLELGWTIVVCDPTKDELTSESRSSNGVVEPTGDIEL